MAPIFPSVADPEPQQQRPAQQPNPQAQQQREAPTLQQKPELQTPSPKPESGTGTGTGSIEQSIGRIIADKSNSPLFERAAYQGRTSAADRGLLHSTIAKEAERAAVLDRATNIATADENARARRAQLEETRRANLAREGLATSQSEEVKRANLAREGLATSQGEETKRANLAREELAKFQSDGVRRTNLAREGLAQQNFELNQRLGLGRLGLDTERIDIARRELQQRVAQAATEEERLRVTQELQNTNSYHTGLSSAQAAYTNGLNAIMSNVELSAAERQAQIESIKKIYTDTVAELKQSYASGLYS